MNRVAYGWERLILHRRGKDVAALVPIEDLALLEALGARLDLDDARAALAEAKEKGTIPWRKIKTELGLQLETRAYRIVFARERNMTSALSERPIHKTIP